MSMVRVGDVRVVVPQRGVHVQVAMRFHDSTLVLMTMMVVVFVKVLVFDG